MSRPWWAAAAVAVLLGAVTVVFVSVGIWTGDDRWLQEATLTGFLTAALAAGCFVFWNDYL